MIVLICLLSVAQAAPGRTVGTATISTTPGGHAGVRGSLDYGLVRHFSMTGEAGYSPFRHSVTAGLGPQVDLLDGKWWRVGLAVVPELVLPTSGAQRRPFIAAQGGVRVSWLAFWGLSATVRVDRVQPLVDRKGWTETGVGLSVRL